MIICCKYNKPARESRPWPHNNLGAGGLQLQLSWRTSSFIWKWQTSLWDSHSKHNTLLWQGHSKEKTSANRFQCQVFFPVLFFPPVSKGSSRCRPWGWRFSHQPVFIEPWPCVQHVGTRVSSSEWVPEVCLCAPPWLPESSKVGEINCRVRACDHFLPHVSRLPTPHHLPYPVTSAFLSKHLPMLFFLLAGKKVHNVRIVS